MAAPDYRNDLAAFFKAVHGTKVYQSEILEALTRKPKDTKDEVFQWSVDHGKAGGDHTAYVRYSYDGYTIHIDEISTAEVYDYDGHHHFRGERPSIADLVARIGQKRCTCNAGYLIREDNRKLQVCTRCDGFSTQRGRRFRARG